MIINLDCRPKPSLFKKTAMPLFKGDADYKKQRREEIRRIKAQPLGDTLIINGKKYERVQKNKKNQECKSCKCD